MAENEGVLALVVQRIIDVNSVKVASDRLVTQEM